MVTERNLTEEARIMARDPFARCVFNSVLSACHDDEFKSCIAQRGQAFLGARYGGDIGEMVRFEKLEYLVY